MIHSNAEREVARGSDSLSRLAYIDGTPQADGVEGLSDMLFVDGQDMRVAQAEALGQAILAAVSEARS